MAAVACNASIDLGKLHHCDLLSFVMFLRSIQEATSCFGTEASKPVENLISRETERLNDDSSSPLEKFWSERIRGPLILNLEGH